MTAKKTAKNVKAHVAVLAEKIVDIPEPVPEVVWNKIFQTYAEDHHGDTNLVELQQNPETKDIRAVKVR